MRALLVAALLLALAAAGCTQRAALVPREPCEGSTVQATWLEADPHALVDAAPRASLHVEGFPLRNTFGIIHEETVLEAIGWRSQAGDGLTLFEGLEGGIAMQIRLTAGDAEDAVELARAFATALAQPDAAALAPLLDDVRQNGRHTGNGWEATVPWPFPVAMRGPLAELGAQDERPEPHPGAIVWRDDEWLVAWRAPTWLATTQDEKPLRIVFDTRGRISAETWVPPGVEGFPYLQERVADVFADAGLPAPTWRDVRGGTGACF